MKLVAFCAMVIGIAGSTRADLDDASHYALLDCQNRLNQARDFMFNMENSYAPIGDFAAGDLVLMCRDYQKYITALDKAVAAYQRGDAAEGATLRDVAFKATPPIDWPRRLQYRQRQFYLDLNDRWVLANASWTGPDATPALMAWVKTKKKCFIAWSEAAESMTDDTDPNKPIPDSETQAIEAAKAADIEEESARWNYEFENSLANGIWRDKTITTPELVKIVQQMRDIEQKRIALHLEDIDRQRRSREYERDLQQLQQAASKAYNTAEKARDAARAGH
jgi:hypothetical protein